MSRQSHALPKPASHVIIVLRMMLRDHVHRLGAALRVYFLVNIARVGVFERFRSLTTTASDRC
jgi:hypothetical protein